MKNRLSGNAPVRLTCESSGYFLDEAHRRRLDAEFARSGVTRQMRRARRRSRPTRRLKIALFALLMVLVVSAMTATATYAQGPHDQLLDGGQEAYHPAYVAYRVGGFHLFRGDYLQALARFDEAIRLLPGFAGAYEARGMCHVALNNMGQALADLQTAIDLAPDYAPTYRLLADVYYSLDAFAQALDAYEAYLRLTEESPEPTILQRVADLHTMLG